MKRGSHYILIAPAFENSDVGHQLDKLRRQSLHEAKRDRYVHRLTTKENLVPDKPKSRAKKTLAPLDRKHTVEPSLADSARPPMPLRESTRIYDDPDNTPMAKRRKQRAAETPRDNNNKSSSSPKRQTSGSKKQTTTSVDGLEQ